MRKVLGYECMTKGCDVVSPIILPCCPKCGKCDWRAILSENECDESQVNDNFFDESLCISEEKLPIESVFHIYSQAPRKSRIDINGSYSSAQNDGSGDVNRIRIIDRQNNVYIETVQYNKTGEIIRACSEKLTDHKGHGSDK